MSNNVWSLLDIIKNEYQDRLNNGIPETQATIFSPSDITSKHNLNPEITDELLDELNENGYIEKWITGMFVYHKVD